MPPAALATPPEDAPSAAPRLGPGDRIGERYEVVRLLGEGGIGSVYEATNTWTGRRVAVKLLQPHTGSGDDILRRFRLEAQSAAALQHPNIVDVLDMGPDPRTGALFIVQELLKGSDLRRHLDARRALEVAEAFDLMIPVMGALAAAHARGFVHRDVKPENIFLAQGDGGAVTPKLIDFGLAKALGGEAGVSGKTRSGVMLGTPAYMSPEQFQGAPDVDERADVWSVGAVLYELLAGRVPFDGPNVMTIMWRASMEPCERLDRVAPAVPAAVADIVHAALVADRDGRAPSIRALLEAARDCPALSLRDGPALTERHRATLTRRSDDAAAAAALELATAPTLLPAVANASARPAEERRSAPPAHPTPLLTGGRERTEPSAERPRRTTLHIVGALAVAGVLAGVGVVAARSAPTAAPTTTTPPPSPAAPTLVAFRDAAVEVAPADAAATLGVTAAAPSEGASSLSPPAKVGRRRDHRRSDHAQPDASVRSHDVAPGGYDPDRLL